MVDDSTALLRVFEEIAKNPSLELKELLDRANGIIGGQIESAKLQHTPSSVLLHRLKQDYARGYLFGTIQSLVERFDLHRPEYEYLFVYAQLIGDMPTAMEIFSKRSTDRWNKEA